MSVLDSGSSDYLNRLSFHSGPAPDVAGLETTFKDNFTASAANFKYHFKSTSEEEVMTDLINSQLDLIYKAQNPEIKDFKSPKRDLTTIEKGLLLASPLTRTAVMANMVDGKPLNDFGYEGKKQRFKDLTFDILKLQEQFPDMGLKTWDQIMQDAQKESTRLKEMMSQVSNNRTWGGVAGMLTGVMKEALTDPVVVASMMFGTSKIVGGSKSFNAMKAFYTEFLIGAGSETVIQPFVMDWSAKLETPWDLKDAAVTILTVGGFAGVTRAGGSYVVDLIDAGKAAKKLRAQGENVKAQTLENYIDLYNGAPPARSVLEQDAQLKAIDDIQKAIDDGKSGPELQLEIERIAKETPTRTSFETPVRLQELSKPEVIKINYDFREPQTKLNLNVDEYHKRAIPLQSELESIGRTIQDELKEAVGFITPGIKLLENVSTKIGRKKYGGTGDLTDVIRVGFLTKEYNNTDSIVKALSEKVEILEEGLVTTPAGYRDHKLLVRFESGLIGEVQIWEPHVLAAKEGKAFVKKNFPKYMQKYIEDMDIPARKNSGHTMYDQQKKLYVNGLIPPKNKEKFKALRKRQKDLYDYAKRFSNESWNSRLDMDTPDSKISTGEAGSQAPGSAAAGTKKPDIDPSEGSTTTAGRPSQSTKSDTSSKLNIEDIIPGDTDRILLNDPQMARIMEEEFIAAKQIIDEAGDEFEVPFTVLDDLGNETTVIQSIKKVFNDIENDENALNSLNKCMGRVA